MLNRRRSLKDFFFFLSNAFVLLSLVSSTPTLNNSTLPSDALALLAFKSEADLNNNLLFSPNTTLHFCRWQGITCRRQMAVRLVLQSLDLGGVFAPNTLTQLDQLRVLSLQNNSLTGPIPDLSKLVNLKSLYLDHNSFTGSFPPSIISLRRLRTIDFSYNNLTGPIPTWLKNLDRLYYLKLDWNRLNGAIPPLNQSSLQTLDLSGNNLTGPIPVTPTLLRFGSNSFSWNLGLCGEIIHRECQPGPPFFGPTTVEMAAPPPTVGLSQSAEFHGVDLPEPPQKKHKQTAAIVGFSFGLFILIGSIFCFLIAVRKQRKSQKEKSTAMMDSDVDATAQAAAMMQIEQEKELEEKVKRVQEGMQVAGKSGNLVFCAGKAQVYTLDQLMRASAELLGRGSIGTTYKAVLDNRLIVSVKRLDAGKLGGLDNEVFERHLECVGGLRHPNLVALRAYFQAKEERLLVYDYQPNGSLFSLIHGSKSTRAKPLHWTSCLKIAEDVAQGLSYIHQAWRLVHGNLKSSNVLLGTDFEACITDYCLSSLIDINSQSDHFEDQNSNAYKAPETRKFKNNQATPKSDVYAFGILLLELLTGKYPLEYEYPSLAPNDMLQWVRSIREDVNGGEEDGNKMCMLLEVAIACSLASPEQRPTMWQVLKMLQEIKETALLLEDCELDSQMHGNVLD